MSNDPMGNAIADYHTNGIASRLRVFAPDFDEDEMPVPYLFRRYDEMPRLEQLALDSAQGKILDVGAAAGPHSLALQEKDKQVKAIDLSALAVRTMRQRGIQDAEVLDFWDVRGKYDTVLMLMNGIGIVGTTSKLPRFFFHLNDILAPDGQVLLESTDIRYLFENEDGSMSLPADRYFGEMTYRMQYKEIIGTPFEWLYLDFDTLAKVACDHGFDCKMLYMGDDDNYLARLTRKPQHRG